MQLTQNFAKFIVETEYENLPQDICRLAKERLLDTIGAMLAGRAGWNYAEALMDATAQLGKGDRTPIGPKPQHRFPAARVAMLNATFAHAIELDDGHKFAGVHAGAVVVPTALEIGAELGCSGKQILTAIVLGYEIVYRLAVAQSPTLINHGFHPSATCDTIGAMVVAGKLMNLNEEQMANGIGMAGLQAAGLMEATVSGQQSKCVMVGNAAFNGISCSYISQQGLEGTTTVFEGKMGLFRAMSKEISPEEVCNELGQTYLIGDTYNKFYPTCRHSQPAIEAALNLAGAHNIDADQVERVKVGTHQVAYDLTGTIHEPQTPGEAKFSIPYGIALALKEHGVSVLHLQEKYYTNPDYLAIAKRVSVHIDGDVNA
ncbi:MAG: MmgE/PrpD family protein, partial [Anaerolineales bacterium]